MDYYRVYKNDWSTVRQFASINDAQSFADSLGSGYVAEFWKAFQQPDIYQKLQMDMDFCQNLISEFLEDNRNMNITPEQSDAVLMKFKDILSFAQTGAVASLNVHLPLIPVDEIFTQERKNKYVNQISEYMQIFE
jgi:hypothetical protein